MEKQKTIQEHAASVMRESQLINYRATRIEQMQKAGVKVINLQNEFIGLKKELNWLTNYIEEFKVFVESNEIL